MTLNQHDPTSNHSLDVQESYVVAVAAAVYGEWGGGYNVETGVVVDSVE